MGAARAWRSVCAHADVAPSENWRFDFTRPLAVATGMPIQYAGGAGIWE